MQCAVLLIVHTNQYQYSVQYYLRCKPTSTSTVFSAIYSAYQHVQIQCKILIVYTNQFQYTVHCTVLTVQTRLMFTASVAAPFDFWSPPPFPHPPR